MNEIKKIVNSLYKYDWNTKQIKIPLGPVWSANKLPFKTPAA